MTALLIAGLVTGSIYAISALGLVMTYVSSRVFNFAHGVIGLLVAWCFYTFTSTWGWPVLPSAVLAIGVLGPGIGVLLWAVLFRRLAEAATLVRLAATIGVSVVIPALIVIVFGIGQVFRPPGLAGDTDTLVSVFGENLNLNQVVVVIVAVVVAAGTALLLRFTGFGLAMRASVDSPTVAALHGTNTGLVSAGVWAIGSGLAGLSGVLLIPFLGLETTDYMLAFIASFAAAVIGRMRSMTVTFVGALVLGIVQETSVLYLPDGAMLPGLRTSLPFLLMMVALVVYNFWRPERRGDGEIPLPAPPRPRPSSRLRLGVGVEVGVVVLLVLPLLLRGFWLGLIALGVVYGVIFLSYTVITGMGSMISLAQISFAAIGALTAAELSTTFGWPVALAILCGGVVAVPFGLLIALPAMRWGGLYLALGTLAFAFLVDNLIFKIDRYDNFGSGMGIDRPAFGGFTLDSDRAFFYLAFAVFAVIAVVLVRVRRSTTGLLFGAIRGSERATTSIGFSVVAAKLGLFAASAFIAGIGGGLLASYLGRATPSQFGALVGLTLLAVIVTIGVRSVAAALIAGIAFAVMPQLFSFYLSEQWQHVPAILFGLGAVGLAVEPRGIVVQVSNGVRALRDRFTPGTAAPPPSGPDAVQDPPLVGATSGRSDG
jgi:branched-chain amino acid transport system permease protein